MWIMTPGVEAGTKVVFPLDNQFRNDRYGMLVDPFGHQWSMSTAIRMNPEDRAGKRKEVMPIFRLAIALAKLGNANGLCSFLCAVYTIITIHYC
jgi:hypothetical protein